MSRANKRCCDCQQIKPLTDFYWRSDRRKPYSECKSCSAVAAHKSRTKRRQSLEIQAAIMSELQQHGPLSTHSLCALIRQRINDDSHPINNWAVAQQAAQLLMVEGTLRKNYGSIWRIIDDPRYQAMPQRRKCYVTNIGMDSENLAWMAEYAAKRTQRGNCQDLAAAVLNQRGTMA